VKHLTRQCFLSNVGSKGYDSVRCLVKSFYKISPQCGCGNVRQLFENSKHPLNSHPYHFKPRNITIVPCGIIPKVTALSLIMSLGASCIRSCIVKRRAYILRPANSRIDLCSLSLSLSSLYLLQSTRPFVAVDNSTPLHSRLNYAGRENDVHAQIP